MSPSVRSILGAGLVGAAVACVANLVVFAVAKAADVNFAFVQFGRPAEVNYGLVALNSIVSIVIGTGLAALLGARRLRLMQIIGAVVAVLTMGGPLGLTGSGAGKAVLAVLHLLTGLVFIVALEVARRRIAAGAHSAGRADAATASAVSNKE